MSLGGVSRHDDYALYSHPWVGSLTASLSLRICLQASSARRFGGDYRRPAAFRPMRLSIGLSGGAGMLTSFPSATAFALALGAA